MADGTRPPLRKLAEGQENDSQTGSLCLDKAAPTRGDLKKQSERQRSDGVAVLRQAHTCARCGGGGGMGSMETRVTVPSGLCRAPECEVGL